jgi:hypothetical protein
MTNPFLNGFDADAHAAFLAAGMADTALLRHTVGGLPVSTPCNVYVDREPASGDLGGVEFLANRAVIRVLREGVASKPVKGDTLTIGADVFTIDQPMRTDESLWEFLCRA